MTQISMTPDEALALLGLKQDCSIAEIKRAFRRLAMKWHPDRNSAPESPETFRQLRTAHDILLVARGALREQPEEEVSDSTETTAGDAGMNERAPDSSIDLEITLEEAYLGCTRKVSVDVEQGCEDCDGRGYQPSSRGHLCVDCHGSGRLRVAGGLERCGPCDGKGYRYQVSCPTCDGLGMIMTAFASEVRVPGGSREADVLRVTGAGEPQEGCERGDLLVTLRIAPHPLYRIVGNDLVLERPVGALRMLLGGRIRIPHPKGEFTHVFDAGPASGREWCISGAGWPSRGEDATGDMRVRFEPVMPRQLDQSLKAMLEPVADAIESRSDQLQPDVHEWERRWLS